jgi:hypothetical protein
MILKYGGVLTHAGRKQVDNTSHVQVPVIWSSRCLMNAMVPCRYKSLKRCYVSCMFLSIMMLCIGWLFFPLFSSTNSHLCTDIQLIIL